MRRSATRGRSRRSPPAKTFAVAGNGSNITVTADGVFGIEFRDALTPESEITASSRLGLSGSVTLNVLEIEPAQGLFSLPTELVDPSDRLAAAPGQAGLARSPGGG